MLIDIFSGTSEGMGPPEGTRYTNKPTGKSDRLKAGHYRKANPHESARLRTAATQMKPSSDIRP